MKRAYKAHGEQGLVDSRSCPENHKLCVPRAIEEKIIHLRTTYHFDPDMIVWHLQWHHNITLSRNGCYQVLVRNKLNRLPQNNKKRSRSQFKRDEKTVPRHPIQVDVTFLFFKDKIRKTNQAFSIYHD